MSSAENVRRVRAELAKAKRRGLRSVIVLGRTADWLLGTHLGLRDDPDIAYHQITHPSPLGLMGMAKRAGKGVRSGPLPRLVMRPWTSRRPRR